MLHQHSDKVKMCSINSIDRNSSETGVSLETRRGTSAVPLNVSTDRPTYSSGRHIDLPGILIIEASVSAVKMTNVLASIGLSNA